MAWIKSFIGRVQIGRKPQIYTILGDDYIEVPDELLMNLDQGSFDIIYGYEPKFVKKNIDVTKSWEVKEQPKKAKIIKTEAFEKKEISKPKKKFTKSKSLFE